MIDYKTGGAKGKSQTIEHSPFELYSKYMRRKLIKGITTNDTQRPC